MTIIFERRQINDKFLIVQFQFDSYDVKGGDVHSLDKYIGLDLWSQIYTKLNTPLEKYKSNIEAKLKAETISMHRAQLELKLTWRNKQPFHREVLNQEKKNCDLCPFVLIVSISPVSLVNKYKKQLSQDKLTTEKSQSKSTNEHKSATQPKLMSGRESSDSNGTRTPNSVDSTENVEEYVPPGITTAKNLNYTPSPTGVKKMDEYTPPNSIKSDSDIITYTPTKIDENKSYKHKSTVKTDLNRNDCPHKKKRTNYHKVERNGRANLRSAKKATSKPQSTNLYSLVSTSRALNDETKINEIIPIEEKHYKNKQFEKNDESRKLKKLRKDWELDQMQEKNIVIDKILNLHDMTFDEITDTLPQNEKLLRNRVRECVSTPDYLIKKKAADYWDYLLLLDGLITSDQQTYMYTQLRQMFFKDEPDATSTNHENLLWCFLVPQWAIHIFMNKFILTKDAAIRRLKDQDRASIQASSGH
ncbi:uncharacterized protein CG4951-like [Contarinia nasturtii]|uniref:uncharacterized protein CG4951-like n=1 Tax=Contarinia nasturtii TaxID=265458 RepID=UPI0012D3EAF4|nr:uncharacterized protein CG4951-like [Contarinia nasturtii]